jgi:hypothetical protein
MFKSMMLTAACLYMQEPVTPSIDVAAIPLPKITAEVAKAYAYAPTPGAPAPADSVSIAICDGVLAIEASGMVDWRDFIGDFGSPQGRLNTIPAGK